MAPINSVEQQAPERPEIVTFRDAFYPYPPSAIGQTKYLKSLPCRMKSLAETTAEVECIQNLPGTKARLLGTRIGVRSHGYLT